MSKRTTGCWIGTIDATEKHIFRDKVGENMVGIEESVKKQFAKVFTVSDWRLFKRMAEFYLQQAAFLLTSNLSVSVPPGLELLARNSQKRLFIGVGIELLVKAIYLKQSYVINKPKQSRTTKTKLRVPFTFSQAEASGEQLAEGETFTLGPLIEQFTTVLPVLDSQSVLRGLKIAMMFRNKEGHTVTPTQVFDASNYRDIECTLTALYHHAFAEKLTVQFSLAPDEEPLWQIKP